MIRTRVFRLPPLRCAGIMLAQYGGTVTTAIVIVGIVAIISGIAVSLSILIIYFALLCLGGPLWLAWTYYRYGLQGESYLNVVDHVVIIGPGSLSVRLRPYRSEEEETEPPSEEPSETEIDGWWGKEYDSGDLGPWVNAKDAVVIPFAGEKKGFLYLPYDAYAEAEEMQRALRMLYKSKENENT